MRSIVPLLLGLVAGCRASAWVESSPDGTFRILAPAPLTEASPPDKQDRDTVYAVTQRHGNYMVFISEAAKVEDVPTIQESLRLTADDLAEKSQAKMRFIHPFVLDGKYQGVDFEADRIERKLVVRARVIYARNRVYRLIVSGDRSWLGMADVNKFFGSFQVLE